MIEKNVHYCWFGGNEKPEKVIQYINGWKKILPDYNFFEWNEKNCDLSKAPEFVKNAYKNKKRAFVSDYFRLVALYRFGGIYLDTDVELLKSFNCLLSYDLFCCFESDNTICTAVIGAKKNSDTILSIMNLYDNMINNFTPNSFLFFDKLVGNVPNTKIDDFFVFKLNEIVFPFYYFSPISFYSGKLFKSKDTFAIHHFSGSWKSKKNKFNDFIKKVFHAIVGHNFYLKIKKCLKK